MMKTILAVGLLGCAVWPVGRAAADEIPPLLALIRSDAPQGAKRAACQRLAAVGTKEAVKDLAPLLLDSQLSHPARLALERIADPAAGEALRAALPRVNGRIQAGVVSSLGARRDAAAVPAIAPLLGSADGEVAETAAAALGQIATSQAAAALRAALLSNDDRRREAAADGCLRCAEGLLPHDPAAARALLEAVRASQASDLARAAAVRGLLRQAADPALFAETLQSPSPAMFAMALTLARELTDPAIGATLLEKHSALPVERRAMAIVALGDRGEAAARRIAVDALRQGEPRLRAAGAAALSRVGDASTIPLLLEAGAAADPAVAAAARSAMAGLAGDDVDRALLAALKAEGPAGLVAIEAAGKRRIAAAVPALLSLADSADGDRRRAALAALGNTVQFPQLPELVARLIRSPDEATAAAVKAACARTAHHPAAAAALLDSSRQASATAQAALVEALASLGGPAALEALGDAALGDDPRLQDIATRALGEWTTPDAAATLRGIAAAAKDPKFRVRALRGYLRVARQMDVPESQRAAICRDALGIAERREERELALETLGRGKQVGALAIAAPYLRDPTLAEAASAAVVAIAERLSPAELARAVEPLRQVVAISKNPAVSRRASEVLARQAEQPPSPGR